MPQSVINDNGVQLSGDKPGCTQHSNLVAGLATLGIPVTTKRVLDDRSGKAVLTYYLHTSGLIAGQAVRTRQLINTFKDGSLEKLDPMHPLLDCMRGLSNAHSILDWIKRGTHQRLARSANGRRSIYVAGSDDRPLGPIVKTRSLAMAAALGVVGFPLIRVEGEGNSHQFIIGNHSVLTGHVQSPATAAESIQALRADSLSIDYPEHPVSYAYTARRNRDRIMAHIDRQTQLILLRLKNSPQHRSAFVAENAADDKWDQAEKHLTQ